MLCSAQNPKLNSSSRPVLPWLRCFLFLRNELFPLRGKVFFCPFSGA